MSHSRKSNENPPPSEPTNYPAYVDAICTQCGHKFIARQGSPCPQCHGFGKSEGEVTKKTFDEPDLKKAF